jgi:hypothetical protein
MLRPGITSRMAVWVLTVVAALVFVVFVFLTVGVVNGELAEDIAAVPV